MLHFSDRAEMTKRIDVIWQALWNYREECIPEGDELYDDEWSDITTAMAWIMEDLGIDHESIE
jgi:transcriptional regulator of met regulon